MDITELQQVQPRTVILGLCIGPKLITASALDSVLSSPKVKAKVRVPLGD